MEIFQMHSVVDQVLVDLEMEILVLEHLVKVMLVVMVVVITWDLPKLQEAAVVEVKVLLVEMLVLVMALEEMVVLE